MESDNKNAGYGWNMLIDPLWLKNFINTVVHEELKDYPREAYQMGIWYNSSFLYGLPERSQHFLLK